jgi:hypothetical protein
MYFLVIIRYPSPWRRVSWRPPRTSPVRCTGALACGRNAAGPLGALNAHRYRSASARCGAHVDHRGIGIHKGGCGVQIQVRKIRVGKVPVGNVSEGRVRVSQRLVRPTAAFRRKTGRTSAFFYVSRIVPRIIVCRGSPGWVQTESSLKICRTRTAEVYEVYAGYGTAAPKTEAQKIYRKQPFQGRAQS